RGGFTGVEQIRIGIAPANAARIVEAPGEQNFWRKLVLEVNDPNVSNISITWRIEPAPPPSPTPESSKPVGTAQPAPLTPKLNRIDRLEYIWIPPGEFEMGCVPEDENCAKDESPRHHVKITNGFWMGRTEVTVLAYQRFADGQKRRLPPASQVNPQW